MMKRLSFKEAENLVKKEYIKLWGESFVKEKGRSIGGAYGALSDDILEYSVDQDDSLLNAPKHWDGEDIVVDETKQCEHRTLFHINLKTGDIKMIEHY